MAKRKKTVRAGNLVKTVLYTAPEPHDCPRARAEKTRATTAARKRINDKTAKGRLEMLLAANFGPEDEFVTLTYDNAHLPKSRKEAEENLKRWIRKLRPIWKKRGFVLRYVYVTENRHGEGRYHHHIMLTALGGNDLETLCSLWPHGRDVEAQRTGSREFDQWAQYMAKESGERPLGARMWVPSKGLQQPEVESYFVPDDTALAVPPNCEVIEREEKVTEYGSYSYVKYRILPPKSRGNRHGEMEKRPSW